jgi:xanthine phosphoribosyltransferase
VLLNEIRQKLHYLGEGIIDASTLLNHQVDVDVLTKAAVAFAERFREDRVTKILTLEVSGIVPALLAARDLDVPMVYARKGKRITQKECYEAPVKSRTTAVDTIITVDKRMLQKGERVLIIDDFLARGEAVRGMAGIVEQADAELLGVCAVFEKTFEGGRESLQPLGVPVLSFIDLTITEDDKLLIEPGAAYREEVRATK